MLLKELKKGTFFTLKKNSKPNENQVYIKGDYDISTKTYECISINDFCMFEYLPTKIEVFTDFIF